MDNKILELKKILEEKGELYLRIKVHPGAAKSEFKSVMQDEEGEILKLNIAAQPIKGKANQELVRFLAQEFGIAKSDIKVISGAGDKFKFIKITR